MSCLLESNKDVSTRTPYNILSYASRYLNLKQIFAVVLLEIALAVKMSRVIKISLTLFYSHVLSNRHSSVMFGIASFPVSRFDCFQYV